MGIHVQRNTQIYGITCSPQPLPDSILKIPDQQNKCTEKKRSNVGCSKPSLKAVSAPEFPYPSVFYSCWRLNNIWGAKVISLPLNTFSLESQLQAKFLGDTFVFVATKQLRNNYNYC